jgi:hypothetical protein
MTTAEIVETLRDEARGWQRSAGRNPKVHLHGGQVDEAVRLHRRFIGIELKRSYWQVACRNIVAAEHTSGDLFSVDVVHGSAV